MTNAEKKKNLQQLDANRNDRETIYYEALEKLEDIKTNYGDYMVTEPINCDEELKRLSKADYELCSALLIMLLREEHFCNGSFETRCRAGQVQPIIDRMIQLLDISE